MFSRASRCSSNNAQKSASLSLCLSVRSNLAGETQTHRLALSIVIVFNSFWRMQTMFLPCLFRSMCRRRRLEEARATAAACDWQCSLGYPYMNVGREGGTQTHTHLQNK